MAAVTSHDEQTQPSSPIQSTGGLDPKTVAVKAGRPPNEPDQPLNPPLVLASTYVAGGELEYGRYGNPTWQALETAVGELEGGQALSFASGMAAVSTLLGLVAPGEKVVAARHCYLGTLHQLADLEQRGAITAVLVDIDDTEQVVAALDDDVALLWIESPTNPALEVADIPALCSAAHDHGIKVVVDNTFATPMLQRPLSMGADIVLHSATKYISGHTDVLVGIIVTNDDEVLAAVDERRRSLGALPGAFDAWLALRGLRTMPLRVERAQQNARELARRLSEHQAVERVRYPGFGGIVSIDVRGGAAGADKVTSSTSIWVNTTSLGGVESTFERRRRWSSESPTIPEGLIRLSVGVEDVDDLWADLSTALDGVSAQQP